MFLQPTVGLFSGIDLSRSTVKRRRSSANQIPRTSR